MQTFCEMEGELCGFSQGRLSEINWGKFSSSLVGRRAGMKRRTQGARISAPGGFEFAITIQYLSQ